MLFGFSYIDELMNVFGDEDLVVFKDKDGFVCVMIRYCDIKEGVTLTSACGRGEGVQAAALDLIKKINGKTLVLHADSEGSREYKFLAIMK